MVGAEDAPRHPKRKGCDTRKVSHTAQVAGVGWEGRQLRDPGSRCGGGRAAKAYAERASDRDNNYFFIASYNSTKTSFQTTACGLQCGHRGQPRLLLLERLEREGAALGHGGHGERPRAIRD